MLKISIIFKYEKFDINWLHNSLWSKNKQLRLIDEKQP